MKVVGLLSGTSADGVDAVLLEVTGEADDGGAGPGRPSVEALAFLERPFPADTRDRILAVAHNRGRTRDVALLRRELADHFAAAAVELLATAEVPADRVDAVGCHGQTVWHEPGPGGGGTTLQLVDPARLASVTGIPVVHDFRSADVAAGGQGAPLVPWSDRILFTRPDQALLLQNLGGMGNLTWLPPAGDDARPVAFDTGPGNVLLDACAVLATGGALRCDRDGALAARGRVDPVLRDRILSHPFFTTPPPRSTGREVFGPALVETLARETGLEAGSLGPAAEDPSAATAGGVGSVDAPGASGARGWADLMATLAAVTVESVRRSVADWLQGRPVDRVVVTGGGAHNPVLVRGLAKAFGDTPVEAGPGVLPLEPDAREAACFGLLAWAFLAGVPGNIPACTGAREPRVLGSWTPAPGRIRPWSGPGVRVRRGGPR